VDHAISLSSTTSKGPPLIDFDRAHGRLFPSACALPSVRDFGRGIFTPRMQALLDSSHSTRTGPNITWEAAGMNLDDYCKLRGVNLRASSISARFAPDESLSGLGDRPARGDELIRRAARPVHLHRFTATVRRVWTRYFEGTQGISGD